jgi:hypothetical protein
LWASARKNGGCPPADTVGLFLAFKCEIRMPPPRFEMAHPISQDYALQIIEKAHLLGAGDKNCTEKHKLLFALS